jgi:putative nucleotidyltransferase with HDIG domain
LPTVQSDPLALLRAAFADRRAWLVGGAVRDRVLRGHVAGGDPERAAGGDGRGPVPAGADLDVVIDGDPGEAARALAHAAPRASAFALSEEYGGWRVVARGGAWQVDVERLRGGSLEEDLALRDFTVNAIAEPLGGPASERGRLIDPLGGLEDLARGRLRAAGPRAFAEDPLRVLRLVRIAVELDLAPTDETLRAAAAHSAELSSVSAERVFVELRRILAARRAVRGLELMGELGAGSAVLPELEATRGVQQSRYHHRDVYGHTLEVLEQTIALQADPAALFGEPLGDALAALLAEPLADELTRGDALRWGALLHDLAKPLTREVRAGDGRVTFIGHDSRGAELAQEVLGRLRTSQRLRGHAAALVRQHLRAGFLVHESQPLARRTVFGYMRACEPVEVDVTLLSVADRLATRGERARASIDSHLRLARALVGDALRWRAGGGPLPPLWRGDELARALEIPAGPRLGALLEELAAARYAGEVDTRAQALAHARTIVVRAGSG